MTPPRKLVFLVHLEYEISYRWVQKVYVYLVLDTNSVGWRTTWPIIDCLRYTRNSCQKSMVCPGVSDVPRIRVVVVREDFVLLISYKLQNLVQMCNMVLFIELGWWLFQLVVIYLSTGRT